MSYPQTAAILERPQTMGLRATAQRLSQRLFIAADRAEIGAVARSVAFARRWRLTGVARIVTRLGNGWLYPIAATLLLLTSFQAAVRCIVAAGASLALAFAVYPPLKRLLARNRPCHYDRRLITACTPLDRHAFPSGHAMTAAAFGVPMIFAAPAVAAPIVIGGCLLVSWSRIALGHHYISDIVAGTLLGGAIAAAVAALLV